MGGGSLRLAFFGTPDFAVPTLERLLASRHEVVVAVCQPDRRRGRGRKASPAPVARHALEAGIPLLRPEKVGDPAVAEALGEHAPDLGIVVAFGQFLPKRIRELPALGFLLNGHASLLPRHRGAAPIAHAILAGDEQTGVSAMRVEREMDAGAVALQRVVPIGEGENAGELTDRLAAVTAGLLDETIEQIASGTAEWTPQDDRLATLAPKIGRDDAVLDWRDPGDALVRRVRAMAPSPGATTTLDGEILRVLEASSRLETDGATPGTVRIGRAAALEIATGDGWLAPRVLQRPGKRAVDVEAFLRGRPISDGTRLG